MTDTMTTPSPYMTTEEVAEFLRCSSQRVRVLVHQGKLPVMKEGRRSLYLRTDVEAMVKAS